MIKNVLFDVDGVIIVKTMRFSERLSQELGIPIEDMFPFFENEFKLCLIGKADLKEELKKYSAKWNWKKSVNDLVDYWLKGENDISEDILTSVKKLRDAGIKCFLSTNNEKYRVDYLLNSVGLKSHFDGIFASGEIGFVKSQPEFWQIVYEKLGKPDKKSVLVWDDDEKNIEEAKKFGFSAELYNNETEYKNKIKNYLK